MTWRDRLTAFVFGARGGAVSDRVREAIRRQQQDSEKLIAWV